MTGAEAQTPFRRSPLPRNAKSLSPLLVLNCNKISKATRISSKFRQRLDRYKYSYLNALETTGNGFDDSAVQDSPLLRLPAEIKVEIFKYLWSDRHIDLRRNYDRRAAALLRTCRRLNIEGRPVFHESGRFDFTVNWLPTTEQEITKFLRRPMALQIVSIKTRQYRVIEHLVNMLPDLRVLKANVCEGFKGNEKTISAKEFEASPALREKLYADMYGFHAPCDLDLTTRVRPKLLLKGRLQQGFDQERIPYWRASGVYYKLGFDDAYIDVWESALKFSLGREEEFVVKLREDNVDEWKHQYLLHQRKWQYPWIEFGLRPKKRLGVEMVGGPS